MDAGIERPSGTYPSVLMPPPPEEGSVLDWHFATSVRRLRPLPRDLARTLHPVSMAPAPAPAPEQGPEAPAIAAAPRASGRMHEMTDTLRVFAIAIAGGALLGVCVEVLVTALRA